MKNLRDSKSLKDYIESNISVEKSSDYYNESFCNLVFDYIGSMGELTKEDIKYLNKNEYDVSDFI